MERNPRHPRAEPYLWPVVTIGGIVALQIILLQVAVNRLAWGMYNAVLMPAVATVALTLIASLLYRHLYRETL